MKKSNRLTFYIFIAMVLGILTGYLVNINYAETYGSGNTAGQVVAGGSAKSGITGYILAYNLGRETTGDAAIQKFAERISILTDIFLRLVKMIIAPLVFSTLVVGVAKLGDIKAVGRIGGKTMLWFISALSFPFFWDSYSLIFYSLDIHSISRYLTHMPAVVLLPLL